MPRTLYGKLAAALLALLGLLGGLYLALTVAMTRLHLQEVQQRLNAPLAASIVADQTLMLDRQINQPALEGTFHTLMVINPAIEVYLVDPAGEILAFSAPPGEVERERIALEPVRRFLKGDADYPLFGDDPRDRTGQKIFSAAPITGGHGVDGYLYIVLGGQRYDSIAELFEGSYVFRLGAGMAAGGLLLALAAGFLSFHWLTRRLRRLGGVIEAFKQGDRQQAVSLPGWRRDPGGDEIDQLGVALEQMSRRIVDQLQDLRHADAARRELVMQVSHDLRTPLAALQGYLETMLIKQDELSYAEGRRQLELALRHGQRLGRLVDELFELATLESRPELQFEAFSLGELVQDVTQKFRLEAERKQVRLRTEIPADTPFVSADIGLIERVLDNLIDNAIKYTPAGGTIRFTVVPGPTGVEASLSDTGPGIPAEDLAHIFDRFYRVDDHGHRAVAGTGLGLTIARRILQLHGSAIRVASRLGAGTTFSFQLPVSRVAPGSRERVAGERFAKLA